MNRKKLFVSVIVLIAVSFAAFVVYDKYFANPIVAEVGEYKIYRNDVKLRDAVNKIYYPKNDKSYGLEQLIKAYAKAEIMRAHGRAITEKMVRKEEVRIDESTRSPETLHEIKKVFHQDMDAYRKVFVLPNLMDGIFQPFFQNTSKFHDQAKEEAQRVLQIAKQSPLTFKKLSEQMKLRRSFLKISKDQGLSWHDPETMNKNDSRQDNLLFGNEYVDLQVAQLWLGQISNLQKNDVVGDLLSWGDEWLIAKIHSVQNKPQKIISLEVLRYPKSNFYMWFEKELAKIKSEN